jgi:hypothetical protein
LPCRIKEKILKVLNNLKSSLQISQSTCKYCLMVSAMSAEDAFLDFFAGFCVTISSSSDLLVPLAEVFPLSVLLKVSTG